MKLPNRTAPVAALMLGACLSLGVAGAAIAADGGSNMTQPAAVNGDSFEPDSDQPVAESVLGEQGIAACPDILVSSQPNIPGYETADCPEIRNEPGLLPRTSPVP